MAKVQRDQKSVTDYFREIRSIIDELASGGARISQKKLVVKILNNLGPENEALSIVIRSRYVPISYEGLAHKLTYHELYIKQVEKRNQQIPLLLKLHNEQPITITTSKLVAGLFILNNVHKLILLYCNNGIPKFSK